MANPVVVFVIPERVQLCSEIFPIGLTDDGQRHNRDTLADTAYCVLLLDDTADVPNDRPCCVDNTLPLVIVAHKSSQKHPDPARESALGNWGIPCVCKRFSHIEHDRVFEEIQSVLEEPALAKDFSQHCKATNQLKQLDGLATLCQGAMLDPTLNDAAIDDLARSFEKKLDRRITKGFSECRDRSPDWATDLLGLVRQEADRLAGGTP